jgi:hypothetical protein
MIRFHRTVGTRPVIAPAFAVLLAAGAVAVAPHAAARSTVTLEAFGPGTATTIDLDPSPAGGTIFDAPLPFSHTMPIPLSTTLMQIVVVGSTDVTPGCRIKVDDTVVVEKPVGGDAHCALNVTGYAGGN